MARILVSLMVFAFVGFAAGAAAQTPSAEEWRQGTTLAGFLGGASGSEGGAVTGAALGWELTPRFGVEGRGTWFHPGAGEAAFAAALAARFSLLPARPLNPFVAGGAGMHHASFDPSSAIPDFYRRRITGARGRTFNDFLVTVGGGVELFVSSHFALRPEAVVLLVTTRSDVRAVPVYGVHLAFHFESHRVNPSAR